MAAGCPATSKSNEKSFSSAGESWIAVDMRCFLSGPAEEEEDGSGVATRFFMRVVKRAFGRYFAVIGRLVRRIDELVLTNERGDVEMIDEDMVANEITRESRALQQQVDGPRGVMAYLVRVDVVGERERLCGKRLMCVD